MKLFLGLMGAMTLFAFAYAQNSTECTPQDIKELQSLTARLNTTCRSSLNCRQGQSVCDCCRGILQSSESNHDAVSCCQTYESGLALYRQCRATLNRAMRKRAVVRRQIQDYAIFKNDCVLIFNTFNTHGGAQLVQAFSAMMITAVAFLAYITL